MNTASYLESIRQANASEQGESTDDSLNDEITETGERPSPHEAVCPPFEPVEPIRLLGLMELILKDRPRLHRLIRNPSLQPELIPRFLAIAMIGFVFFGVSATIVFSSSGVWPKLIPIADRLENPQLSLIVFESSGGIAARWLDGSAVKLIAAYTLGLIAATGICLPILYFYGLLAGVRMTMLDVVIHALKSKATAAVALVGILPIYVALSMGMVIFGAPTFLLHGSLLLGLILPFIAGFWGTYSMYFGFSELCDTLPPDRRERRACFLRRLVVSWSACYSAVTPVMIFTLWEFFGT